MLILMLLILALGTIEAAAMPPRPERGDEADGEGDSSPRVASIGLYLPYHGWTVVQWQDETGWHDVEGWQAPPQESWVIWNVEEKDLGKGPFRWAVFEGQERGESVALSDEFYLPQGPGQELSLEAILVVTVMPSPTLLPTATELPAVTSTPTPTETRRPIATPIPLPTHRPTPTATRTPPPVPTSTSTPVPTLTLTPVPTITSTPTPTSTPTSTPAPIPTLASISVDRPGWMWPSALTAGILSVMILGAYLFFDHRRRRTRKEQSRYWIRHGDVRKR